MFSPISPGNERRFQLYENRGDRVTDTSLCSFSPGFRLRILCMPTMHSAFAFRYFYRIE
jgi:hypothetical protein